MRVQLTVCSMYKAKVGLEVTADKQDSILFCNLLTYAFVVGDDLKNKS